MTTAEQPHSVDRVLEAIGVTLDQVHRLLRVCLLSIVEDVLPASIGADVTDK